MTFKRFDHKLIGSKLVEYTKMKYQKALFYHGGYVIFDIQNHCKFILPTNSLILSISKKSFVHCNFHLYLIFLYGSKLRCLQ
jgi:hypothetical protein